MVCLSLAQQRRREDEGPERARRKLGAKWCFGPLPLSLPLPLALPLPLPLAARSGPVPDSLFALSNSPVSSLIQSPVPVPVPVPSLDPLPSTLPLRAFALSSLCTDSLSKSLPLRIRPFVFLILLLVFALALPPSNHPYFSLISSPSHPPGLPSIIIAPLLPRASTIPARFVLSMNRSFDLPST